MRNRQTIQVGQRPDILCPHGGVFKNTTIIRDVSEKVRDGSSELTQLQGAHLATRQCRWNANTLKRSNRFAMFQSPPQPTCDRVKVALARTSSADSVTERSCHREQRHGGLITKPNC